MKKEYINPAIEIVKIETIHMIADSGTEGPQALGGGEETDNVNDLLSRRGGFWDDEEEEY